MRARASILLVLIAAALLAGCGGGDGAKDDYVTSLNQAQDALLKRVTQLNERITATSTPAQDRATLKVYETAVDTAVRDLRAIDPPSGLDQLHQQFVREVAEYGAVVRQARDRLSNGSVKSGLAVRGTLPDALERVARELNATIKAINAKLQG
ncbi:MAG TPA: hypothetical protein VFG42_10765 [Baekduia sp.]|uniref:hypothetical protein n=1 Tax=Baekduia sp. TaxID=2600305 RepID=UPI002D78343A|nr:hypothetical protein [Baekduia sp.]HET6507262.1 hypothetical protein [Baekduia sp.]